MTSRNLADSFFLFIFLETEVEKTGVCEKCNTPYYIECGACYAILHYRGEDHKCPEKQNDEGFFEEDVELCDASLDIEDQSP